MKNFMIRNRKIVCYNQSGNKISSKKVSCVAQNLGFGGIANIDSTYTTVHVDIFIALSSSSSE